MKLVIKDGRDYFWTYDNGRVLIIEDYDSSVTNIQFESNEEKSYMVEIKTDATTGDKYVIVPFKLLTGDYDRVVAFFYCQDSTGTYTLQKQTFRIKERQEPSGLVIDEDEIITWDKIKALAEGYRDEAKASAEEALTSETNAKTSETNAKTSEENASASASQASADESSVSAMKESVEESAEQVASDKSEVSTMKSDISAMKSEVTVMKESVDSSKAQTQQMKDTTAQYKSDVQSLVSIAQSLVSKTVTETIIVNGSKVYKKSITIKNGRPYCTLTEVTE